MDKDFENACRLAMCICKGKTAKINDIIKARKFKDKKTILSYLIDVHIETDRLIKYLIRK